MFPQLNLVHYPAHGMEGRTVMVFSVKKMFRDGKAKYCELYIAGVTGEGDTWWRAKTFKVLPPRSRGTSFSDHRSMPQTSDSNLEAVRLQQQVAAPPPSPQTPHPRKAQQDKFHNQTRLREMEPAGRVRAASGLIGETEAIKLNESQQNPSLGGQQEQSPAGYKYHSLLCQVMCGSCSHQKAT